MVYNQKTEVQLAEIYFKGEGKKEILGHCHVDEKGYKTKLAIFKGKKIRKTTYKNEWWFVVEDIVLALIDSKDSKQYIQRMKQRDLELNKGWVQIVHTLEFKTAGGLQKINCANEVV